MVVPYYTNCGPSQDKKCSFGLLSAEPFQVQNYNRSSSLLSCSATLELPFFQLQLLLYFQGALCAYCHDRIWGLGRQGFKCLECKLMIHKKCHKLIERPCTHEDAEVNDKPEDANSDSIPEISKYF